MAARKLFLSLAGVGASMATAGVVVMAEADHKKGAGSEKAEPRQGSGESQQAPVDQLATTHDNKERYSVAPIILMVGKKESGVMSEATSHPGLILGVALTTVALLAILKKSLSRDKMGTQRLMRHRIAAQFFTIAAFVAGAGVTYFVAYDHGKDRGQKKRGGE